MCCLRASPKQIKMVFSVSIVLINLCLCIHRKCQLVRHHFKKQELLVLTGQSAEDLR